MLLLNKVNVDLTSKRLLLTSKRLLLTSKRLLLTSKRLLLVSYNLREIRATAYLKLFKTL